jgi:DNA gyrase subunit B
MNKKSNLNLNMVEDYHASSIQVLRGLEAVKMRPGMYIGNTDDGSGLHHLIFEVIDNSIDEALAGHADTIMLVLHNNEIVTVVDNGRGIPVDIHHEEGISAAEVILTKLHAGGKFDKKNYKVSGGLHGLGVSVVNALSEFLKLSVWRDGKEYYAEFADGNTIKALELVNTNIKRRGTRISFKPSINIFSDVTFNFNIIENRLRELSFLNPNIHIVLINNSYSNSDFSYIMDEENKLFDRLQKISKDQVQELINEFPDKKIVSFFHPDGIKGFVQYLSKNKTPIDPKIVSATVEKDDICIDFALMWTNSYTESLFCFTNNIPQRDGGTHTIGFRTGLSKAIIHYYQNNDKNSSKIEIVGDDIREGIVAVLSIKIPDPKFSSQTCDL